MTTCWACRAGLPHVHQDGQACPHEPDDGTAASCCADERAERVELLTLVHDLRTGKSAVPDSPAGVVLADDERT